jgi:putative Mg2+ transporter-C (MgtC) family protein
MELELMLRLLLSVLFGGAIGYVREITKKAAGLRTHTLVCLGSCLFTITSVFISQGITAGDPSRIAASVVTGIGFIGAGTIFVSQGSVKGLTTAASIWVCAAIGVAVGTGMYLISSFATILALLVIQLLQAIEHKYMRKSQREENS